MEWVRLEKYCEITGEKPEAVRKRRRAGVWLDGRHTKMRNRRLWVNTKAADQWGRHNPALLAAAPTAAERAGSTDLGDLLDLAEAFEREPGIYFLFDGDELVYIGQSKHVYGRLAGHVPGVHGNPLKSWTRFATLPAPVEELVELERLLIARFRPKYNGAP